MKQFPFKIAFFVAHYTPMVRRRHGQLTTRPWQPALACPHRTGLGSPPIVEYDLDVPPG